MISLITSVLLGISAILTTVNTQIPEDENFYKNELSMECRNDNLMSYQWHNNGFDVYQDYDSSEVFDKFNVDLEEAQVASDIYMQEEILEFDELIPRSYINENCETFSAEIEDVGPEDFIHNKGYIKFTTVAYGLGYYDGAIVYHIEVTTTQQKSFVINKNDDLIIRCGNNATTLNVEDYRAKGTRVTPFTMILPFNEPVESDIYQELEPDYSFESAGVYYKFGAGGTSTSDAGGTFLYGNTVVNCDYYLIATDTTAIQPVYIHDYNPLPISISISFGPIGTEISTELLTDVMEGKVLTLKGGADRIKYKTYSMDKESWGFDQRYYFENEGIKTSQYSFNDLVINTRRLRCGYIEEEYINLSPNRIDAGDAYLELLFNKPIYEVDFYATFWSDNEGYIPGDGDYAYVQILDDNNNWVTYMDLLEINLPTNRKKPKYLELEFIEGTSGIRFIAHKENPNTNRNKGRISLGDMKFVRYYKD